MGTRVLSYFPFGALGLRTVARDLRFRQHVRVAVAVSGFGSLAGGFFG